MYIMPLSNQRVAVSTVGSRFTGWKQLGNVLQASMMQRYQCYISYCDAMHSVYPYVTL